MILIKLPIFRKLAPFIYTLGGHFKNIRDILVSLFNHLKDLKHLKFCEPRLPTPEEIVYIFVVWEEISFNGSEVAVERHLIDLNPELGFAKHYRFFMVAYCRPLDFLEGFPTGQIENEPNVSWAVGVERLSWVCTHYDSIAEFYQKENASSVVEVCVHGFLFFIFWGKEEFAAFYFSFAQSTDFWFQKTDICLVCLTHNLWFWKKIHYRLGGGRNHLSSRSSRSLLFYWC